VSRRVSPFDVVFGELADERFPALQASLAASRIDAGDRDAFILDKAVTEFLRDLVPEDAPPESLHEFIAVLQHCFVYWSTGRRTIIADSTAVPSSRPTAGPPDRPAYIQLPSHLYWGQLEPDAPHEPLDGFFVHAHGEGIRALAIFGLHPDRPGFSVAEVQGALPGPLLPRADGSLPFAPQMDGGENAGIRSVSGPAELLALACHALHDATRSGPP
jgi:hypothetical protein